MKYSYIVYTACSDEAFFHAVLCRKSIQNPSTAAIYRLYSDAWDETTSDELDSLMQYSKATQFHTIAEATAFIIETALRAGVHRSEAAGWMSFI